MLKEIKKYDYRIVPQYTTFQQPYFAHLYLWDDTGMIGQANFMNSEFFSNIPKPSIDSYGKVNMYFRTEEFPMVIDMLRNEKPVYLFGKETPPTWFVLTTTQEPVGEGEMPG
jgi:hypothetical protein